MRKIAPDSAAHTRHTKESLKPHSHFHRFRCLGTKQAMASGAAEAPIVERRGGNHPAKP